MTTNTDFALTTTAPTVTTEQLTLVQRTIAEGATPDELKLYLFDCARQGVHPLDKLLHFTKRGGKYVPITSIDFMRIRAAETGEYVGSDDVVFSGTPKTEDFMASITVYRLVNGTRAAFAASSRWSEYRPSSDGMWQKMPHTMLGKCAEALALRKGFPRQLSGLYAREELDQANDSPAPKARQQPAIEAPPQQVVNVATGEFVSAVDRPDAPAGFQFIDEYKLEAGTGDAPSWHSVVFYNADAQGGSMVYKTKIDRVGDVARQAFADGLPVKVTSKKFPWLDKVEVWKPAPLEPVKRSVPLEEPLDVSDIPF